MTLSPRSRIKSTALAAIVSTALIALAGCSSTTPNGEPAADATRTVDSAFGEVTIPTEPQAALGIYTTDVDVLITLGIPLASAQPIRSEFDDFPSYLSEAALEGIDTFVNFPEVNYEAVAAAEPDFILNSLGYDQEIVDRLPDIAPTYSLDGFDGQDWRVHFEETAIALDRVEEFEAWEQTYEQRLDEVRTRIGDQAQDLVVTVVYPEYGGPGIQTICGGQTLCSVYQDLGIEILPLSEQDGGVILSPEQFDQLNDANVALTVSDYGEMTALTGSEAWQRLPFVQNDQVLEYDLELSFGSPSSQLALLDEVENDLIALLSL
ncbi:ABC transporter substrate-binding protein [Microbacterium sp.]|uniref:ABC transporter substrate-binding protein n=1 Tax=Microbacterium sp. TaxID=51671 RepID=UPI003F994BD6